MKTDKIIGFDFGHGDTSLTCLVFDIDKKEQPDKITLFESEKQITAISIVGQDVFIGERAYYSNNSKNLRIAFKKRPSRANDDDKFLMQSFVSSIYRHIVDTNQILPSDNNLFYIGCPSGWTEVDRIAYQELFLDSGIPNVTVVSESRAALMFAYERDYVNRGAFVNSVILVIDVGSSTTDITITQGEKDNLLDFGHDLGATYLDKMILDHCLTLEENKTIKELISKSKGVKMFCELQCRKNKEDFFNNYKFYKDNDFPIRIEPIEKGVYFTFEMNSSIMDNIINKKLGDSQDIRLILNDHDSDLLEYSWLEAFRNSLVKSEKNITDIINKSNLSFNTILLTGGASKMYFIPEICMEVFPNIEPIIDNKPQFTIANGLSRWGRTDLLTKNFEYDVNHFIENQLSGILKKEYPRLISMLTEKLGDEMVEKVVKKRIIAWRNGYVSTLNSLTSDISSKTKEWLKGHEANELIKLTIESWLLKVVQEIRKETDFICEKYGISGNDLVQKRTDDHSSVNTGTFDSSVSIGDPTELGEVLGYISTVVLGIIVLLLTNVIIFSGPIGWIVGVVAFFVGRTFAENVIQDSELPSWVRNLVTDEKIESSSANISPEIKNKLNKALQENNSLEKDLISKITDWMSRGIEEETKKARLLII